MNGKLVHLPLLYLDWNIFDLISKNRFGELKDLLISIRDEGIMHIPYSEWHLYEAINTTDDEKLIQKNLNTIRCITNMVYVWEDDNPVGWIIGRNPIDSVFDINTAQELIKFTAIMMPLLDAILVVKESLVPFGLVPNVLNNYDISEIIEQINTILLKPENIEKYKEYAPNGTSFEDIIELSYSMIPIGTSDIAKVSGVYILINLLGYFSDKVSKGNFRSLWIDSMHVAWASKTQILISNDRRLRKKALLTYKVLGISTLVYDPEEALNALVIVYNDRDRIKLELQNFYDANDMTRETS